MGNCMKSFTSGTFFKHIWSTRHPIFPADIKNVRNSSNKSSLEDEFSYLPVTPSTWESRPEISGVPRIFAKISANSATAVGSCNCWALEPRWCLKISWMPWAWGFSWRNFYLNKQNIGCKHPMIQGPKLFVVTISWEVTKIHPIITQHHSTTTCGCLTITPIWGHWLPTLLSRPQRLGGKSFFHQTGLEDTGFLKEQI